RAATPAPRSTTTSSPCLSIRFTVSGVAATRVSPGRRSLGMKTFAIAQTPVRVFRTQILPYSPISGINLQLPGRRGVREIALDLQRIGEDLLHRRRPQQREEDGQGEDAQHD